MASASNSGMTFALPQFMPGKEIMKPDPPSEEGMTCVTAQERIRILLVDDDPIMAESLNSVLNRLGFKVTCFTNSLEAMRTFQEHPDRFDLVVTDQKMPDLEGDQLAEQVLHIRPNIPILLCTGFTDIISKREAKAKGIQEFLTKPFSLGELVETIRRLIRDDRRLETCRKSIPN